MLKIIAITLSVVFLLFVIDLIRRERLTFKYAFGWIAVSLLASTVAVFDRTVEDIAHLLGFELASNFIFFTLIACFVFLSLLMTIFLCQQNIRNDAMVQKIATLEFEIEKIKEKSNESKN